MIFFVGKNHVYAEVRVGRTLRMRKEWKSRSQQVKTNAFFGLWHCQGLFVRIKDHSDISIVFCRAVK